MALLNDITLGKYVPADSVVHRLDPRTKLIATLALMSAVLSVGNLYLLLIFGLFLAAIIYLSGLPAGLPLKNLRAFAWLFFFTFTLHACMTEGTLLWRLPYLETSVTAEGLERGALLSLRLAAVIVTASLLMLTTAPMELTNGLEKLFGPLRRFGFPAHEMAMMVTIALRFVPVLVEEAERLRRAQLARGASFGGGPVQRARNLIPLLVPLFISAFEHADRLALAMESRCYGGGGERTSYCPLHFCRHDLRAALVVLAAILVTVWPF